MELTQEAAGDKDRPLSKGRRQGVMTEIGPGEFCDVFFSVENVTLPETSIFAPENGLCQKETSIPTIHFWVLC